MKLHTKILLIYTGGTIGMIKDFDTGVLKPFNFKKLLERIPELKYLDCHIETISFENPIDSSNMKPKEWISIASMIETNYMFFDGFVVLHGSDTMAYSASALSFMFKNLNKPIIFTGSQLPIGDLRTDAKENLITSIQIASLSENAKPLIQEVCLYFEYKLYRANRTTKINAEDFNAFDSPNFSPLAESGVHLKINKELLLQASEKKKLEVSKILDHDIVIVKIFPGLTEQVMRSIFSSSNLKGIILETYGSGNAPTMKWFVDLLKNTIDSGLPIVNITQCLGGRVNMGQYETSTALKKIGVISGKDMTTEAAVTKMMYLLSKKMSLQDFRERFEISLRGELS